MPIFNFRHSGVKKYKSLVNKKSNLLAVYIPLDLHLSLLSSYFLLIILMYLYMYKYDLCVGLQLLVFKVHIRPIFGRYKYLYRTIFLSQRNYMSRRTSCSLIFLLTLFSRTPFLRSMFIWRPSPDHPAY